MNNLDTNTQELDVLDVDLEDANLNSWLLENINIMEELSIIEPTSWREVDTPG